MTPDELKTKLEAAFPQGRVLIRDLTGTQDHYQAVVGDDTFAGRSLMEQHRMVYDALGAVVGAEVHALMLRTCTPDRFDRVAAESNPDGSDE